MFSSLPPEVQAAVREFRTCEFTTVSKSGNPVTWPVSARYQANPDRFILTTTIGFPNKIFNIRRNPKVSLLFSNPTACGLTNPPAVLIQGDATAGEKIMTSVNEVEGLHEYWRDTIFRRQPTSAMISSNPVTRWMMDWYYMRILITIVPRAYYWWPESDFSRPACKLEVTHVE